MALLYPRAGGFEEVLEQAFDLGQVEVLLGGDVMLDRSVRTVGAREGYDFLFAPLRSIFDDHDVVVVNLEGPITPHASVSEGSKVGEPSNFQFTFDPSVAHTLKKHRLIAHVGNNHINDWGTGGISSTHAYARAAGLRVFGDTGTDIIDNYIVVEEKGTTLGLVSFNEFVGGSLARAQAALRELRPSVDVLVVYAHWGDEYEVEPHGRLRVYADSFVDAGADVIVGSHPHVVGITEMINDVSVYYSLGNLIFDQYWDTSVRCGALLSLSVRGNNIVHTEHFPVYLTSTRQTVLDHEHCGVVPALQALTKE